MQTSAVACGFGPIGWLEPLRSQEAMAGYFVKLARELTGEKDNLQIPIEAHAHFRRLRASVRLLPPPLKNPDMTGLLHFCRLDGEILTDQSKRDTHKKKAARKDAGRGPDNHVLGHSDPENL
jgi:hypothetical protein